MALVLGTSTFVTVSVPCLPSVFPADGAEFVDTEYVALIKEVLFLPRLESFDDI